MRDFITFDRPNRLIDGNKPEIFYGCEFMFAKDDMGLCVRYWNYKSGELDGFHLTNEDAIELRDWINGAVKKS